MLAIVQAAVLVHVALLVADAARNPQLTGPRLTEGLAISGVAVALQLTRLKWLLQLLIVLATAFLTRAAMKAMGDDEAAPLPALLMLTRVAIIVACVRLGLARGMSAWIKRENRGGPML